MLIENAFKEFTIEVLKETKNSPISRLTQYKPIKKPLQNQMQRL